MIRAARPTDAPAIRDILLAAFPTSAEADPVVRLEQDCDTVFGFLAETAVPFASPYAGPHLMALALADIPLPARGRADYAPAFAELEA